jgi:hypothetical protein
VVEVRGLASRRQLLAASGAALASGTALALAGCSAQQDHTVRVGLLAPPARQRDILMMHRSLSLEFRTVAAYTAGIPQLSGSIRRSAVQFLHQELSHMTRLGALVKRAGGKPYGRADSYDFGHPGGPPHATERDILVLLHALERAQVTEYLAAIPQLAPGPVRAEFGAMLTDQAQHISVLREALGLPPVPFALVNGAE